MRRELAGLALVLIVTGCGGGAESTSGTDIGALAADVTAQLAGRTSAHVTFEVTGGATGDGGYRTTPDLAADFTMTGPDGPSRFIMLDGIMYVRPPRPEQPARPWLRFAAGRQDVAALAGAMIEQADIGRQLGRLRQAGTITATATETVDGQPVYRYKIDLDVARLAEAEADHVLKTGLRELRAQGVERIPYELWLDGTGLPVKITMDLPGQSAKLTIGYTRWGEPVDVTAPPADQVIDAPDRVF
ncbi:MAG TPA: hypothetical protein VGX25_16400 [Actinophytocola sp.]|uniref:hypothetical protein n=1 Tax=Actinophytocola sp. TaxID=1872138 RepID=UPI002DDD5168|nr:hypothetical protein [Actinophytocola sp.]HEV2780966.1 hypothetical protein [Actinophytocola sp.]